MQLLEKIRAVTGLKNYGISPKMRDGPGVLITIQGLDAYDRDTARSMRLDVLCGLRRITGLSWSEFGKWLDDEFLPAKNNKREKP